MKGYVKFKDLNSKLKAIVNDLLGFDKKILEAKAKIQNNQKFYKEDSEILIGVMKMSGWQGIEKGETKIFLQQGQSAPSFRQVMENVEGVPEKYREILEKAYNGLIKPNGERLIIK